MKKKDTDQLRNMSVSELAKKAAELRKQITEELLKRQSANVKNVHVVRELRKARAQVLSAKRTAELAKER